MKNFTLKVAAVLFGAAFAGQVFAGTPFTKVVLQEGAQTIIEGENFDKDGWNVSFHTTASDIGGVGAAYRDDIVAADGTKLCGINASSSASNGYIVGWTDNIWTIYTIEVKDPGKYKFTMLAGAADDGKSKWALENMNEEQKVEGTLDKTDHVDWDVVSLESSVILTFSKADTYEIKFSTGGGFNFDCWYVEATDEDNVEEEGNAIPGTIDCTTYDPEDYYWWIVEQGLIGSPSNGGANIGWSTPISDYENEAGPESPDYVKYKVNIKKAGDYNVYFNASNDGNNDSALNLYFYNIPLTEEPIHFFSEGGWSDYNWVQGGAWHYDEDEFEAILDEPAVITIKDEWVGENKTIKLEVVNQFNMHEIKFVPAGEDFDGVDAVVAERIDNVYYNLQGMKVANPTKGIYVINGKKVLY